MELPPTCMRVGGSDPAAAAVTEPNDKWQQNYSVNPLFERGINNINRSPNTLQEHRVQEKRRPGSGVFGVPPVGEGRPSSRSLRMYGSSGESSTPISMSTDPPQQQPEGTGRTPGRDRAASSTSGTILRLRTASSSIAESLNPVNVTRRTRAWCRTEGATGTFVVIVLCATIVGLLIIFVIHCTPLLEVLVRRPGVRKILKVDTRVSISIGVLGSILLLKILWSLMNITCRHSATQERVGTRVRQQKNSAWRVMRAWDLFEIYTTPGGRYFDVWEYTREVVESMLQLIAVVEYAYNGVGKDFLTGYLIIIALNAFGAFPLMLPKCAPSRWNNVAPENRATLERSVLLLDVVCDALCTSGGGVGVGVRGCVCVVGVGGVAGCGRRWHTTTHTHIHTHPAY